MHLFRKNCVFKLVKVVTETSLIRHTYTSNKQTTGGCKMKNLLHTLKIPAALIILLIISVSVNSQTVISSVSASENAKVLSKQISNSSESIILKHKSENWMSNKSYLDFESQLSIDEIFIIYENVIESEKEIEDWMIKNDNWKLNKETLGTEIHENSKGLEEWMFDKNFWNIKTDKEYHPIEDWMTNNKFWVTVD